MIDPTDVRGIRVLIACGWCKQEGWVTGGKYKGEVVRCHECRGAKMIPVTIKLSELYDLLHGNLLSAKAQSREIKMTDTSDTITVELTRDDALALQAAKPHGHFVSSTPVAQKKITAALAEHDAALEKPGRRG